jgi:tight adherence protein C
MFNMTSNYFLLFFIILAFILLILVLGGFKRLYSRIPKTVRLNMDEIPKALSRFWWLVSFCQYYFVRFFSKTAIDRRSRLLSSAGLEFFLTPGESYALQFLGAACFSMLSAFVALSSGFLISNAFILITFTGVLGWFYPIMWMRDQRKKMNAEIIKSLPSLLDIMTLCTECGLSLNAAFSNYVEKGPKTKLRSDIERVLRDVRSGSSRVEALTKAANRITIPDFSMLVSLIAQCETLGSPLGPTLRKFAEQKRSERFQRAEKLAMEAPMKILGPLVIFIFPITFVIIAFPIVASIMENIG